MNSESSDGSEQNTKNRRPGKDSPDAMKNICGSWGDVKIPTSARSWKKLITTLSNDFERFNISEEVTVDLVEITRELDIDVEAEYVTELLHSHDKTSTNEEMLLINEGKSGLFRWSLSS